MEIVSNAIALPIQSDVEMKTWYLLLLVFEKYLPIISANRYLPTSNKNQNENCIYLPQVFFNCCDKHKYSYVGITLTAKIRDCATEL